MKRRTPDPVTGRVYNPRYPFLLVCQHYDAMRIRSRHRSREAAVKEGRRMLALSENAKYAVLILIGNPTQDYLPGDVINPSDVGWLDPRNDDRCSVCCHPFAYGGTPQSLDHRCPVLKDTPLCPQVQSLLVKKE